MTQRWDCKKIVFQNAGKLVYKSIQYQTSLTSCNTMTVKMRAFVTPRYALWIYLFDNENNDSLNRFLKMASKYTTTRRDHTTSVFFWADKKLSWYIYKYFTEYFPLRQICSQFVLWVCVLLHSNRWKVLLAKTFTIKCSIQCNSVSISCSRLKKNIAEYLFKLLNLFIFFLVFLFEK